MDMLLAVIVLLSFGLSFLFALGGVGAAVVLIPTLTWLGVPFNLARPTGLFINCVSLSGATWSNYKSGRLDIRLGLPIAISAMLLAPAGAWAGQLLPTRVLLFAFIGFLFFSGLMMLFFKGGRAVASYREDRPVLGLVAVGIAAGFISGLLGVGGGGMITPLMIRMGFNPKRVAMVNALSVPFSSLSAFFAYLAMGSVSVRILVFAGLAAWAGGYLGTRVMHKKMKPGTVKQFLGCILILLGAKLLWSLI